LKPTIYPITAAAPHRISVIEGSLVALFERYCELDLEDIVAKYKHAPYDPECPTWFKIRNRNYSQMPDVRNYSNVRATWNPGTCFGVA
jgi:ATP-dependent DNA ligase